MDLRKICYGSLQDEERIIDDLDSASLAGEPGEGCSGESGTKEEAISADLCLLGW